MESIQCNTCLAMTGAIRGTSKEKLYQELGSKSLSLRLCYRKLCFFYKVFKNEDPEYLFHLIPVRRAPYISILIAKHALFKKIFSVYYL